MRWLVMAAIWEQQWGGGMPAGIYHDPVNWLISVSADWINWFTIADKNLWASVVYNDWDILSESNCGWFFQRWNNYIFPYSWVITNTSTNQVDTTWYWPWNYYSSSTWILQTYQWFNPDNYNLWGRETWTHAAMQWPCANWFYVPSSDDITNFSTIIQSLWLWLTWQTFKTYFKYPYGWDRDVNWVSNAWVWWWYRKCEPRHGDIRFVSYYRIFNWGSVMNSFETPSKWHQIRPFKDIPVIPDNSRTVLYQPSS